ncbi:MAG: hypothetical protein ACLQPN_11095 [Bryobacteraceae bacterium]
MIVSAPQVGHWRELLLALWMATVFAERLVVDLATVNYFNAQRKSGNTWRSLLRGAAKDKRVFAFLIPSFSLLSFALLLNRADIDAFLKLLHSIQSDPCEYVRDFFILLLFYWLVLLYRKPQSNESIRSVMTALREEARNKATDLVILIVAGIGFVGLTTALKWLAAKLLGDPRLKEVLDVWVYSNLIVSLNTLLYCWIYRRSIAPKVAPAHRRWFWPGFVKDTMIYTLAATVIANGLNRFVSALDYLEPRDRWITFALFATLTSMAVIAGITGDLWFVKYRLSREYPHTGPGDIMRFHIYFRFTGLFTAPLVVWFGYVGLRIAAAAGR